MRHVHNYRPVTAVRPTVYRLFSAHPGQDFSLAGGQRERRKCTTFFLDVSVVPIPTLYMTVVMSLAPTSFFVGGFFPPGQLKTKKKVKRKRRNESNKLTGGVRCCSGRAFRVSWRGPLLARSCRFGCAWRWAPRDSKVRRDWAASWANWPLDSGHATSADVTCPSKPWSGCRASPKCRGSATTPALPSFSIYVRGFSRNQKERKNKEKMWKTNHFCSFLYSLDLKEAKCVCVCMHSRRVSRRGRRKWPVIRQNWTNSCVRRTQQTWSGGGSQVRYLFLPSINTRSEASVSRPDIRSILLS